jgi:endo-1,3-1,4-beta-glycanase ExoK
MTVTKLWRRLAPAAALAAACVSIPETESRVQGAGGLGNSGASNTSGSAGAELGGAGSEDGGAGSAAGSDTGGTSTAGAGGQGTTGGADAVGGAAGAGANSGVLGHPDPAFEYPTYPGYTLALVEEFDEELDLVNDPIWTYSDGGEPEGNTRFTKDRLSFSGGSLRITVDDQDVATSYSYAEDDDVPFKSQRSGELRTKYNNYRYGRYEARIKAPYPGTGMTDGNFILSFFVSRQPKIQEWRQIEFQLLGQSASLLMTNIYYAEGTETWMDSIDESISAYPAGTGAGGLPNAFDERAAFHVYAFDWTPAQVRWYVDGGLIRVKDDGVGDDNLPVPELSTKIRMQMWIFNGNAYGGDPATNVYPFTAEVDWFRFYRLDSETTYPCSPAPACLPAEDTDVDGNNDEVP